MKTLTYILLLTLCYSVCGQYLPKEPIIYNEYRGMWIVGAEMGTTFFTVHQMNLSTNYLNNVHMYYVRDRQRATVFLTGMVVTAATYFILQKVNKKYYRRHGVARK